MVKMKEGLKKVKKPASFITTKKKKKVAPKKMKIQDMSVDDFLSGFNDEKSVSSKEKKQGKLKKLQKVSKIKKTKKNVNSSVNGNKNKNEEEVGSEEESEFEEENGIEEESELDEENGIKEESELDKENGIEEGSELKEENEEESENESNADEISSHKKQLSNLKKSDPEFYKYLEENDQDLLNFDESDSDNEPKDDDKFHKPAGNLEVASDESDYEPDEEVIKKRKAGKSNRLTKEMIDGWQKELLSKNNINALRSVTEAFHAAVVSVSPDGESLTTYKVEGAAIFNSVIRLCVVDFLPGLHKALKVKPGSKFHPEKCKNWKRVKVLLKNYLADLEEICTVSSPNMLSVLLKHVHQMCPFIACFPAISPKFLKRVIQLWAMDEDVVRVLAFLCALRLGNLRPTLLKQALKVMHVTYVRNTKFVSPSTLPGINFMRQSLCEMFALDTTTTYQMAFLCIRQLAIHIRNAITLKKKDSYKVVLNWAYISSLHLWATLLGMFPNDSSLKSLLYPLVQIIIGTIKLIPSAQYFPLRFHCVKILNELSNKTGVFIPVLPFLLEILKEFNFNREHKKLSLKPMDLTCLLRCSKSQMKENGFKDAIIENINDLMLENLALDSHRVSFPDTVVPCVIEVKRFIKICTVANYNKKLKAIVDKIQENSKFIENERKKVALKLDDPNEVEAVETAIKAKEPPFLKYYNNWKKIRLQQQAKRITDNEKLGDFKLPVLYKMEKKRSRMDAKSVGPPELFPSDDDSDGDDIFCEEPVKKKIKQEKPVKEKKIPKKEEVEMEDREYPDEDDLDDGEDIVRDLTFSDFD